MARTFPSVTVTKRAEESLRGGHPWVWGTEITATAGAPAGGDLVDVYTGGGKYMGTGFYNAASKITVRLVSRNANDRFDDAFWERRLRYAVDYRRTVMGADFSACRLIFGEADCFPGWTVDRFGSVLVTQILTLGIERRRDFLLSCLVRILREGGDTVDAVYVRGDHAIRELEGMREESGFFTGEGLPDTAPGDVEITENGIRYRVDYLAGQKTGFFLDQKYNRLAVRRLARGKRVLDCFTHTGAFALNAAMGGAESVTAVDISGDALETARRNAALNGLSDRILFREADVFELLASLSDGGRGAYDLIILDPPAFTKSRDTVKAAIRGYREINRRAMQLLPRGGYLATCSCSHFMTDSLFRQMLHNAAEDAKVSLRQIEARQQSPDHPILWNVPETQYLKFYLFQVV